MTAAHRVILCVDLDAFFASAEIVDNPALADPRRPLAVGSPDPHRGVISTASYAARAHGVRSGMSTAEALHHCPALRIVAPRHDRYAELGEQVADILRRVTPEVEPASIDEAYLDATAVLAKGQAPAVLGAELRRVIRAEVGLAASVGIGTSKLIAKIACGTAKPDGIRVIHPGDEAAFLAPMPARAIPGIGPKTAAILDEHRVHTCAELAKLDASHLRRWFGPKGGWMAEAAAGIDHAPVQSDRVRRSFASEITLDEDASALSVLEPILAGHAVDLARRLRTAGLFARSVTVRLRDADFRTISRSARIPEGSADERVILAAAGPLLAKEATGRAFRLVGLAVSGLVDGEQLLLFARSEFDAGAR